MPSLLMLENDLGFSEMSNKLIPFFVVGIFVCMLPFWYEQGNRKFRCCLVDLTVAAVLLLSIPPLL